MPIIDPNYLGDERDLRALVTALRLARQIGCASAYDEWREAEAEPGPAIDDVVLRQFAKNAFQSNFHPVGTYATGDPAMPVVDSELRAQRRRLPGRRRVRDAVDPSAKTAVRR
ncbi:GMC oxidoreductase [Nocardia sp. NPDC057440]|uniref:GMC oxidoreductase n=1 Tax=Nocardia sp. NPDC057440 TaxID=3346134 RepID=UPI00366FAA11